MGKDKTWGVGVMIKILLSLRTVKRYGHHKPVIVWGMGVEGRRERPMTFFDGTPKSRKTSNYIIDVGDLTAKDMAHDFAVKLTAWCRKWGK
jgi:hypothetical protein